MINKTAVSLCNTPMQILNTINLMVNNYMDFSFDLVISDEISNGYQLYENIKKAKIFNNVYFVKIRSFIRRKTIFSFIPFHIRLLSKFKILSMNKDLRFDYDYLFFSNINKFANIFCYAQNHLDNIVWFEEGVSSYCIQGGYWQEKDNRVKRYIWKILNLDYINRHITSQFMYHPELAEYEVPFERKKMDSLNKNISIILELANRSFGYNKDDLFNYRFIYFEESYRVDGYKINDKEIISKIANIVNRSSLMIKIHPRSKKEYFEGYTLNDNTTIPWELYYLNNQNNTNLLISISSGCIISPFFYFNDTRKVISLLFLLDTSNLSDDKKRYLQFMKQCIFDKHKDIYLLPRTFDELEKYLIQFMEPSK